MENFTCAHSVEGYRYNVMKPRPSSPSQDDGQRNIRRNLVRRASELATIHGRDGHEPTREDVQQAKREVKPLKMPEPRSV